MRARCFFQLFRLFPISNRMGEKHRCARLHMASLNPLLLPRGGGIICTGGKSRNRYLCVLGGEAHDCRRTRGRNSGRAAMNCTAANRLACQVRKTRSSGVLQIPPPPPPAHSKNALPARHRRLPAHSTRDGAGCFCFASRSARWGHRALPAGRAYPPSEASSEAGAIRGVVGHYQLPTNR